MTLGSVTRRCKSALRQGRTKLPGSTDANLAAVAPNRSNKQTQTLLSVAAEADALAAECQPEPQFKLQKETHTIRILRLIAALAQALFSWQKFWILGTVALSFVCGKYCPIID